ncbi:unnamed protein product [Parnassius apollo]|uniref:(apollo) hypothetical protein n=1 Tax=Parnassius apollo TaxID=110799 RepID=A0A8S3XE71_PARAO|nr:unnamed protein product [Parnassius apollo]
MSRQLSENAIAQILEDCSDSESEEKQEISEDEVNITLTDSDEAGPSAPEMKLRCFICPRAKDKKITIVCKSCNKTICKPHSIPITYCLPCQRND